MSYKFDSLMAILNKLDNKEKVTVQSLKDDLEVSERSVHRYLNTLMVAGFPIQYDKKKGSYRFDEGYALKKPNLSVEESLAFALSKKMLKNLGGGFEKGLSSIEQKLSIKSSDIPRHIILKADEPSATVREYLDIIHQAITNFKRIEIVYKSLTSTKESIRKVDPYYLFFKESIWYLKGDCHLRKEFRTFSLVRIISMRLLNEHFIPKAISPEDDLSDAFGPVASGKLTEVVLKFNAECKPYILGRKWHQSQKTKELKNGKVEVRFRIRGLEGIKIWLYRWLPHVKIISPNELKDMVSAELKKVIKNI